jgi:NACHT domain
MDECPTKSCLASTHDDSLLAELKPKDLSRIFSAEACIHGTRQDILATIDRWIEDLYTPNILWLRGHPGVGKSAVAASVVERLQASRRLGSSFFFQRNTAVLTTPAALWRTVAFDLARKYPDMRRIIVAKLSADEIGPNVANVNVLFRHFIHEPLTVSMDIPRGRLPVVVVDALDECGGFDGRYSNHRTSLLQTLKSWSRLPSKFKLIITSRGEDDIADTLSAVEHETITISSGQLVTTQSSDDVQSFLQQRFLSIAAQYRRSLPPDWPGPQIIKELAERAAGLFIYAETVLRFVVRGEPQQQLQQILKGDMQSGDMAELYSRILAISFPDPTVAVIHAFHSIVGAIILAKIPLSYFSLARLLRIESSMVDFICQGLRSVLYADDVLRFSHQSSVDFLVDPDRCPPPFLIKLESQNRQLVQACFHVMKHDLRFNICDIPSSYLRNDDVDDIFERVEKYISPQLSYSCRFVADHLIDIGYQQDIAEEVGCFIDERFFYWLEVLSLTKHVSIASEILLSMASWMKVRLLL